MNAITTVVWSATAMGSLTAGLFFLRFWRDRRERLFLIFALAFFAFTFNWALLALDPRAAETQHYSYTIRLAGIVLLLFGIIDKNRH